MAGRKKGHPKTGGRQKGTANKNSLTVIRKLEEINFDIVSAIVESIAEMPPYMRADPLLKLMEFIYPKRKALETPAEPIDVTPDDKELEATPTQDLLAKWDEQNCNQK